MTHYRWGAVVAALFTAMTAVDGIQHFQRMSEAVTWIALARELLCAALLVLGAGCMWDLAVTLWTRGRQ